MVLNLGDSTRTKLTKKKPLQKNSDHSRTVFGTALTLESSFDANKNLLQPFVGFWFNQVQVL